MNKTFEKILILTTDFITINLAWIIYYDFRVKTGWFKLFSAPEFLIPMFVIYFYWVFIFLFVGMYQTWFAASRFDELSKLFKSSFVGIFILFFLIFIDDYVHKVSSSTRILVFIYWGLFLFLVGVGRLLIRSVQRNLLIKGFGRKNVLIVGFNPKGFGVQEQLIQNKALGLDVEGFISVDKTKINSVNNNAKVLGTIAQIEDIIDEKNIKEVIIALDKNYSDMMVELISKCENKNVRMKIVPDLYEILSGQAKTSQIYGVPLIDIMPELMPDWEKKMKRVLDVLTSLIILLISLPISIIIAIAIKLDSKGPILFKQQRCGMDGTLFNIMKFRSMFQNAEETTGPIWSQKGDPRVTKIGKIIRKLRLDELPQMINVLKGEMSIVGPRPERPFFVKMLSKEIPYYNRRLKVRPGITGWAQVKHKYDESIEDVKVKLRYDLFYIENMSLKMDFKIIVRTVFVMLFGKGQYE
jgi:exopolysaccharide biosynthesis polyprenyl glycosylphosphotransferase